MHRQSDAISVFCKIAAWLIVGAGLVGCADTTVLYQPTPDVLTELTDPVKALSAVRRPLDQNVTLGWPCSTTTVRFTHAVSYSVSGSGVSIRCADNVEHVFVYKDITVMEVIETAEATFACVRSPTDSACLVLALDQAQEWVNSWFFLAQPRSPKDPATDAQFRDAIQRTPSDGRDRPEELRRYQVQVENALKENRALDAVLINRTALEKVPAWPQGHFNLSLLYEGLEFYPEAITEMRRYLYLLPNAPDARAAQDKIYEWEGKIAKISAVE